MELKVNLNSKTYPIIIEAGLLSRVSSFVNAEKVLIVTDDGVPKTYLRTIKKQFKNAYSFVFLHGEIHKNMDTVLQIIQTLIDYHFSKNDCLIALGGGVVSDIVGFVSLIYKRGIHFISIPTTTLCMVDACLGGKTAVNFSSIKNVLGGFSHPDIILIDPETLITLPKRHFINGTIEALKVAILGDKELYRILKDTDFKENYEEVIYRALSYKIKIVEQDEYEKNIRKLLNFGHTFGHALESYFAMRSSLHGEAIGLGMLFVSKNTPYYEELKALLKKWKVRVEVNVDANKILELIQNDKKCDNGFVDLIVVKDIEKPEICKVNVEELINYLREE